MEQQIIDHGTGEILNPDNMNRGDWERCIAARWQDAVDSILDVGKMLVQAKRALPHGEFGEMELPFSNRAARMLMAVARHPILANRNHGSDLPPSWRTLYELTKLPESIVEERLATGELNPGTERSDVRQWQREHKRQELEQDAAALDGEPSTERGWGVERGQVWQLGRHRVMCGDAYNPHDRQRLTAGVGVDALISDPPYGIDYQPEWEKWDYSPPDFDAVTGDDSPFDPTPFLDFPTVALFGANHYSNRLPVGGWVCWDKRLDRDKDRMFGSPFELAWFQSEMTSRAAIMIRELHGGVVNADSQNGNNERRYVATQKPVKVMAEVIDKITPEGCVVMDPFAGSGSTLLACEATGRDCLAMEIEPDNVAIILDRWHEGTGVEPCLA